ncbi:related to DAL2-allantoinase [Sporisorium reilianum f. sp. reilianum]|uniref:allantoicase n=1 Tax=Sporisorium reilianum f. sp. reilianum TaxID=72559 RepID=A0A2N8UBE6_9BASI|nr:related to DAL2-allantoinase [Sporisorium reilianum f. sp. reilianum]
MTALALDQFDAVLGSASTEISSVALGGRILSTSDEWFAPASSLLKVGPAPSLKGQFGPKGALFDGWETRRHNPTYDWVILRLGPNAGGRLIGFDVDTANFSGNEAPEISIHALALTPEEEAKTGNTLAENDERWECVVPVSPCGPSQRHLFTVAEGKGDKIYTHIKLHMIPDGGIARFRVYGVIPPPPVGQGEGEQVSAENAAFNVLDLAHCLNGGRVVFTDDNHFGAGSNIILPGRGKDMGDGWETRRSRAKGHFNWSIVKLGEPGFLSYAEVDTAHFLGNFPESTEILATVHDSPTVPSADAQWVTLLPRSKLGPGRRHFFALADGSSAPFTHVMVKMHPDGGIKRFRVHGRRASPVLAANIPPASLPAVAVPQDIQDPLPSATSDPFAPVSAATSLAPASATATTSMGIVVHGQFLPAVPLTTQAFASYGAVIDGPSSSNPDDDKAFKIVNQGTARKYLDLAEIVNNYPHEAGARTNVHVYRCDPAARLPFEVKLLERHRFTTQAFIPMVPIHGQQQGFLVVVAHNGQDDRPDLTTLGVFLASTEQAIQYHPGIWHHPMIALGTQPTDFACIVNESGSQPQLDCDEVEV